ncbi:MAG: diguanylate cyclase [Lactobacillus delbrueckii]|nr:diguanylate cyclase [Lactobacillus delbrueckii]
MRAIGQALDDVLQTGNDGIVCRYGGDEFLAVITVTDDKQADKLLWLTEGSIRVCPGWVILLMTA